MSDLIICVQKMEAVCYLVEFNKIMLSLKGALLPQRYKQTRLG